MTKTVSVPPAPVLFKTPLNPSSNAGTNGVALAKIKTASLSGELVKVPKSPTKAVPAGFVPGPLTTTSANPGSESLIDPTAAFAVEAKGRACWGASSVPRRQIWSFHLSSEWLADQLFPF